MAFVENWLIPLLKVIFIGGVGLVFFGFLFKAFWNVWSKKLKFTWKYTIRRKPYPEKTVKWIIDCINKGIGWYGAKKIMMVAGNPTWQINETLWIYDKVIQELNKQGGVKNGREHKGTNSKVEIQPTGLPEI